MANFILSPYNGVIDLSNKKGRKLYDTGCTDVKKEQRFDGLKEKRGSGMGCSYNRADFKKKMKEKKEEKKSEGGEKKYQPSNDFKIT
eukprot:755663-Ditylum_brightwellii.AAC.1